jgi:hypothetical protein
VSRKSSSDAGEAATKTDLHREARGEAAAKSQRRSKAFTPILVSIESRTVRGTVMLLKFERTRTARTRERRRRSSDEDPVRKADAEATHFPRFWSQSRSASRRSGRVLPRGSDAGEAATKSEAKSGGNVPRDGIEPPTRGFSILCSTD